jgi:hypothetical protein
VTGVLTAIAEPRVPEPGESHRGGVRA